MSGASRDYFQAHVAGGMWDQPPEWAKYESKKMSTTAKAKDDDYEELPAGTHPAYCIAVVDLGYQDSPYGVKEQVLLRFETPLKKLTRGEYSGQPMTIWAFYTNSLSKRANLRKDLEAWRQRPFTTDELKGFELRKTIGKPCTITTSANEGGRVRVTGVSAPMDGIELPKMHNPQIWFDLDEHGISSDEYRDLPEWIREIIGKRVNPDSEDPAPAEDDASFIDSDIPFMWAIMLPLIPILSVVGGVPGV